MNGKGKGIAVLRSGCPCARPPAAFRTCEIKGEAEAWKERKGEGGGREQLRLTAGRKKKRERKEKEKEKVNGLYSLFKRSQETIEKKEPVQVGLMSRGGSCLNSSSDIRDILRGGIKASCTQPAQKPLSPSCRPRGKRANRLKFSRGIQYIYRSSA